MKHLKLENGDAMPALGLGTWQSAPGEVGAAVREAIRLGYRHIDCAAIYGNEAEIGAALAEACAAGDVAREDLWITSKLWNNAHRPDDVRPALEKTLADLGLEQLDLYLMHWPVALEPGVQIPRDGKGLLSLAEVPLAATWRAMAACQADGLCRHIGVSNFSAAKIRALMADTSVRPAANQVEMHPYLPQNELVETCRRKGVIVTAYSPLGSPGRPPALRGAVDLDLLGNPVVAEVAARHAATRGQVLIAWALHRDTSVIPKSVDPKRLAENLAAADLALDAVDMQALAGLEGPHRLIDGSFWTPEGSPYTQANLWDE